MSLDDVAKAIAAALEPLAEEVPELQIYPYYNNNPSPPSIDIYPATPFQIGAGFGIGNSRVYFTVRALVGVADLEAASQLLYRLLDPNGPASVEAALAEDDTAELDSIEGEVSGIGPFTDVPDVIGATWKVGTYLR